MQDEQSTSPRWKIFMEAVPDNAWPLEAGWYGMGDSRAYNNTYIYWRTTEDEAQVFDREGDVIETIQDARRSGYPCHAVPPITTSY